MSYIRFFHGCAEMGHIAIYVGGMPVTRQLSYGESTPHFLMNSGQTTIRIEENGVVKLQNHVIIPKDLTYTLLILCRSGFPEMIAIEEDGQLTDETQSGVRIGSFADSAQPLDFWHRFADTDEMLFSQVQQGDVTEYVQLEPGEHRWEIRENGSTISMLPGQQVEKGKLYTVYMIGKNDVEEEEHPAAMCMLRDVKTTVASPQGM